VTFANLKWPPPQSSGNPHHDGLLKAISDYFKSLETPGALNIQVKDLPAFNLVNVEDYLQPANITDHTVGLRAAAARIQELGGGVLWFKPGKNYSAWATADAAIFDFSGLNGVYVMGNGATITSALVNAALLSDPAGVPLFDFNDASNCLVENLTFIGGNTTLRADKGEQFVWWGSADSVGTKNLTIRNCKASNCQAFAGNSIERNAQSKNITIENCVMDSVFYPLRTYATDNLKATYRAIACGRDYFPINPCAHHDVTIDSTSSGGYQKCLIKIYADSAKNSTAGWNDLADIKVRYKNHAASQNTPLCLDIQQSSNDNAGKGNFRNIDFQYEIIDPDGTMTGPVCSMSKYKYDGTADTTERGHTCRNVRLHGTVTGVDSTCAAGLYIGHDGGTSYWNATGGSPDIIEGFVVENFRMSGTPAGNAIDVDARAFSTTKQSLLLRNVNCDGNYAEANATDKCIGIQGCQFGNKSAVDQIARAYTVSWTSSGSAPSIGNGTLTGRYSHHGEWTEVSISLTIGSTTTIGTGDYSFSLPVNTDGVVPYHGSAYVLDSGTSYSAGICRASGSALQGLFGVTVGNYFGAAAPIALATGDVFECTLRYRRA